MHLFRVLLFLFGALGIADTLLMLAISGGINLGTLLPGGAGALLVVWAVLRPDARFDLSFLHHWNLKTGLCILFTGWMVSFIAVELMILFSAFGGAPGESGWCILLGAGVRGDQPSLTLQRRLRAAAAYLKQYPAVRIVVSGGRGLNERITEAEVMRRCLEQEGIEPGRIFMEERATSTLENLKYSKEIMAKAGARETDRITIVSSDFHLMRIRLLAKRLAMNVQTISAPTPWYLLPNTCLREYFAFIKSLLFDHGG